MGRLIAILGLAGALASGLPGCGGGGSTAAGDSFVAKANAVCALADHRVESLSEPESVAELVTYLGKTEAVVVGLRQKIEQLDPSGQAVGDYLDGLTRSGTVLNEMVDAAQSQNPDAVGELSRELVGVRLGRLARRAGLAICAKPLVPRT
jgi:hypothetical protein